MTTEKRNDKSVVWMNVFTIKPGKLDEFIAIQSEELQAFARNGKVLGWLGSRLYRSVDDNKATMMSVFESVEAHKSWNEKADFSEHIKKIGHLIENTEGGYYTVGESVGIFK
ncbi:putative quinol monooxygenase [Bacillus sp. JCM 19034]|uniref:putative quinol monooxygenase n=1 Tax=Bacillus sp. JCM 19034 TaxID=1481928 RepID=UPI0007817988|nr:antibiotic biosynthesis monooxygenase family protein [Bacillus sp. JCM 19034]